MGGGDQMINRWFMADPHFDHEAIASKMGRKVGGDGTIESWNQHCLDCINKHVARTDFLYFLGDFCWKRPGFWRTQIRCKNITLIRGNHDTGITKLREVFGSGNVTDMKVVKIHGVHTVLFHYPIAFWDRSHHGSYHLYGHIHYSPPRERLLDLLGDRKSMDVSPEAALDHFGEYRPFHQDDIHSILSVRKGHDFPKMPLGDAQ